MLNKFGVLALSVFCIITIVSGHVFTLVWLFLLLGFAQYVYNNRNKKSDSGQGGSKSKPDYISTNVAKVPVVKPVHFKKKPGRPMPLELKKKLANRQQK